jgi:hypothetical protein
MTNDEGPEAPGGLRQGCKNEQGQSGARKNAGPELLGFKCYVEFGSPAHLPTAGEGKGRRGISAFGGLTIPQQS